MPKIAPLRRTPQPSSLRIPHSRTDFRAPVRRRQRRRCVPSICYSSRPVASYIEVPSSRILAALRLEVYSTLVELDGGWTLSFSVMRTRSANDAACILRINAATVDLDGHFSGAQFAGDLLV